MPNKRMGQLQSPIENVAKQRTQMPKELTKKQTQASTNINKRQKTHSPPSHHHAHQLFHTTLAVFLGGGTWRLEPSALTQE